MSEGASADVPLPDLDRFKRWKPDAQARALALIREQQHRRWVPFYCKNRKCNGQPHRWPRDERPCPHPYGHEWDDTIELLACKHCGVESDALDDWQFRHARVDQRPPNWRDTWLTLLLRGGRGSGKTRTGAEITNRATEITHRIILIGSTGPDLRNTMVEGEALALDTVVHTPAGPTTMAALKVGDVIYGGDGKPCSVTEAFPVLTGRPCYLLDIDGEQIVADAAHKWVTSTHAERSYGRRASYPLDRYEAVRTTEQIALDSRQEAGYPCSQHGVAVAVVEGEKIDLPVDPYTLGYWLGDGTSRSAHITSHPEDQVFVREFIEQAGYSTRLSLGQDRRGFTFLVEGLSGGLRGIGVMRNKHVPEVLFAASRDQRLGLLAGLMDSDGTVSERGQFEFSNKNADLVRAVSRLCASLGIKSRVTWKGQQGRVRGRARAEMFRLPRKVDRAPAPSTRDEWRYIRSIESVPSVPVRCIAVDSPDHTFLVGDQMIRTHNSGLLATASPGKRPTWEPSKKRLTWPNGCIAEGFSAEEPDRLRGPQSGYVWADEPSHWPLVDDVWDNMLFGLRLPGKNGHQPKIVATSTPKPNEWTKAMVAAEDTVDRVVSTYANLSNLAETYQRTVIKRYEGSRTGLQELEGKLLEDVEGALWTYGIINHIAETAVPSYRSGCVAIDPAGTANKRSDDTGITVQHHGVDDKFYVAADYTGKYSPDGWANEAIDAALRHDCDVIVYEKNYGGEMVETTIRNALKRRGLERRFRLVAVTSRKGKELRAEPIVGMYEQGEVLHVGERGDLKQLEEEQTTWVPHPKKGTAKPSPNRIDAVVHGLTYLARGVGHVSLSNPNTVLKGRRGPTNRWLGGR